MNRPGGYLMALGLVVFWVSVILGDEHTSATTEKHANESGHRSDDPSGSYKTFGYPDFDQAEELARISGKPMMIVFR